MNEKDLDVLLKKLKHNIPDDGFSQFVMKEISKIPSPSIIKQEKSYDRLIFLLSFLVGLFIFLWGIQFEITLNFSELYYHHIHDKMIQILNFKFPQFDFHQWYQSPIVIITSLMIVPSIYLGIQRN